MEVRRSGGLTEFIPTPQEKRDGVIRDHALDLLANLHDRLRGIEAALNISEERALEFETLMHRIRREEARVVGLRNEMASAPPS